ncbi:MAG: hypothetical protein P8X79_20975, partial [Reinekea sp.]
NNTIQFTNFDHLASLSPDDYLTMRLYSNEDAGNVLWEYAFEYLHLETQWAGYEPDENGKLYVSADQPEVPLQALLIGYANRSDQNKKEKVVRWYTTGNAILEKQTDSNHTHGAFFNTLQMPTTAGAQSTVKLRLSENADDTTAATLGIFEVVPGAPNDIQYFTDGKPVHIEGVGERRYTFTVKDQYGNLVADHTGVRFNTEGSLRIIDNDDATMNGQASITVAGAQYSEMTSLTISVGDASRTVDLEVKPLTIELTAASDWLAGERKMLTAKVKDSTGELVKGVDVSFASTYGYVSDPIITTDNNGAARTLMTAPGSKGSGEISARVALGDVAKNTFSVSYADASDRDLEVNNAIVVGDASTLETVSYTRYDGQVIDTENRVSSPITVYGDQGESVTVRLGDLHDPNLPLLYGYYFNDVYEGETQDETGRSSLLSNAVSARNGTRMGGGKHLDFSQSDQSSLLWTDSLDDLQNITESLGFSLEIKPSEQRSSDLFNIGQGAYRLSLDASGIPTLSIRTADGEFSISANVISQNNWTRLAGRYHDNQLVLSVDGAQFTIAATGALDYQWTGYSDALHLEDPDLNHDLIVGRNYTGQMNSFRWFDYQAQPLLTFDDASTERTFTIPTGQSEQTVNLISTGNLGWNGALTKTQKVSVNTNKVSQYASLVSTPALRTMLSQYMAANPDIAPPVLTANLNGSNFYGLKQAGMILEPVQAGWFTSFLWEAVNWVVPLDAFGEVIDQLGYLATNDPDFSPLALAGALVESLSVLPPAKGIKFITKPLRATLKVLPPKAAKQLGGAMKTVIQKAKKGDFDTLWNLMPFMVMIAQVGADPEAREGLIMLLESATSAEDILAYVDFFALPADGWEGDEPPPQVDAFSGVDESQADDELGALWGIQRLQPVYAGKKNLANKIPVSVVKEMLKNAATRVDAAQAKQFSNFVGTFVKSVKKSGTKIEVRKLVTHPQMLGAGAALMLRGGARAIEKFATGKSTARMSPATLVATIAFVEWQYACGEAIDNSDTKTLDRLECNLTGEYKGLQGDHARSAINTMYMHAFGGVLSRFTEEDPRDDFIVSSFRAHGAMFHLTQVAYFQGLYLAGGDRIKDIEATRWIYLYPNQEIMTDFRNGPNSIGKKALQNESAFGFRRQVDIVLETDASTGAEKWVELKSYSAQSGKVGERHLLRYLKGKPILPWELVSNTEDVSKRQAMHKQFSLDRVAAHTKHAWMVKKGSPNLYTKVSVDNDFTWRFQEFQKRSAKGAPEVGFNLIPNGNPADSIDNVVKSMSKAFQQKSATLVKTNLGNTASFMAKGHIKLANSRALLSDLIGLGFSKAEDLASEEWE